MSLSCHFSRNFEENYAHVIVTAEADSFPTDARQLFEDNCLAGCHSSRSSPILVPVRELSFKLYSGRSLAKLDARAEAKKQKNQKNKMSYQTQGYDVAVAFLLAMRSPSKILTRATKRTKITSVCARQTTFFLMCKAATDTQISSSDTQISSNPLVNLHNHAEKPTTFTSLALLLREHKPLWCVSDHCLLSNHLAQNCALLFRALFRESIRIQLGPLGRSCSWTLHACPRRQRRHFLSRYQLRFSFP